MASEPLVLLIPVFDDWHAAGLLLDRADRVLAEAGMRARVLFVDDGSVQQPDEVLAGRAFGAISIIDVLTLRRNLGHQRAVAIGLAFAAENIECDALVVMDGDGEDVPDDIPRLLDKLKREGNACIVFAERTRRAEGRLFRICYQAYKAIALVLTGVHVRVGNFSVIPGRFLAKVAVLPELWNHYSAAVFVARLPRCTVPAARGQRLGGSSKMDFQDLVVHGLRALSVFGETIAVRLLIFSALIVGTLLSCGAVVLLVGLFSEKGLSVEMAVLVGFLVMTLFLVFAAAAQFAFVMVGRRSYSHFLPCRDHRYFVDSCRRLSGGPPSSASGGNSNVPS